MKDAGIKEFVLMSPVRVGKRGLSIATCTDFYTYITNPSDIKLDNEALYNMSHCTLHVPKVSKELYQSADQWSSFKNIEEFEVEEVPGDFDGNGTITVFDLQVMLNAILTFTPDSRFDLTGDGNVNAADIAKMIDIVMGR